MRVIRIHDKATCELPFQSCAKITEILSDDDKAESFQRVLGTVDQEPKGFMSAAMEVVLSPYLDKHSYPKWPVRE